jgi:hypothetical protein
MTSTELVFSKTNLLVLLPLIRAVGFRAEVQKPKWDSPTLFKYNKDTGLGTIKLVVYGRGVWRWHVDHYQATPSVITAYRLLQKRGAYREFEYWRGPQSQKIEISCSPEEVPVIGAWLPSWVVARDNGSDPPVLPCPAYEPYRLCPIEYLWTDKGIELYSKSSSS